MNHKKNLIFLMILVCLCSWVGWRYFFLERAETLQENLQIQARNIDRSKTQESISQQQKPIVMSTGHVQEFKKMTTLALKNFPTLKDIQALSHEEVHFTPHIILQAGVQLGEIAELLQQHSDLKDEAAEFYETCSMRQDYPNSIRSVCYARLKTLNPNQAKRLGLPKRIRMIANVL